MLINVAEELQKAREEGYAIGAFNTANLEVTKAICAAAKGCGITILIQTTPKAIQYAGLEQLYDIVINEIEETGIDAAIHLDHAKEINIIRESIEQGYKSVMFDGSALPLEENIKETREVVEYAHEHGVSVEAEVGVIGKEEDGKISGKAIYSNPADVKRFVDETGVDSVAISVGNEHGAPAGERVNLSLLRKISEVVKIPLVMHGSSGLSEDDIRAAISCGVAKFNIDTNIKKAFTETIEQSKEEDYREVLKEGEEKVEEVVKKYIDLFGNRH